MSTHNVPWVESVYFEEILKVKSLTPEETKMVQSYHNDGFVIVPNAISTTCVDEALSQLQKDPELFSYETPRAGQLWKSMSAVKKIAADSKIMSVLELLYDRKPIPFQTINFKYGSRQKPHSDSIHFNSMPERFMCGAWTALEDIDEDSGPVVYYPGSQSLPMYNYQDISDKFLPGSTLPPDFYHQAYEPFIQKLIENHNLKPVKLLLKKGDTLIWSANILHGGSPILNTKLTRWSQVTHYFFEDCLYYTPLGSNTTSGEYQLRKIYNIATDTQVTGNYNGEVVNTSKAADDRYFISPSAGLKKTTSRFINDVFSQIFKR